MAQLWPEWQPAHSYVATNDVEDYRVVGDLRMARREPDRVRQRRLARMSDATEGDCARWTAHGARMEDLPAQGLQNDGLDDPREHVTHEVGRDARFRSDADNATIGDKRENAEATPLNASGRAVFECLREHLS